MHTFCSSLTKFSSTKSVQTRFVATQKPLIDTFFVIKVIISYDNFIAIDPMKKFGARFRLQFHGATYRPDSFVLMLRHCVNLKPIRYESTSLNRTVADKSHRVIVALVFLIFTDKNLAGNKNLV